MPPFTTDIDTVVHVFQTTSDIAIGQQSQYATVPHPGTGKVIDGWGWDRRTWPTDGEFKSTAFAPSIWDPTTSGLDESKIQAGFGDNDDLLLLDIEEVNTSGVDIWAPRLQHGYFYVGDEEWYLFSDAHLTEYFTVTGVDNGEQVLTLTSGLKPTNPLQVRNFKYDIFTGRYIPNLDFRKKVEFSVGDTTTGLEYLIDTDFNPPQLRLNGEYNEVIGGAVSFTGPSTDPTTVSGLEKVGVGDGSSNQRYALDFCPVDPSQPVEVWTWSSPTSAVAWDVIEPLEDFIATGMRVKLDRDTGTLTFPTLGDGMVPTAGVSIGTYYTTAVAVAYEPSLTKDDILAYGSPSNINPIESANHHGFVQVSTQSSDPASIILTSTLPQVNPFIINLGNNIGNMIATVKDAAGNELEGQEVTFDLLSPVIGTFGTTATSAVASTNGDGEATTLYNAPLIAEDLGVATINVTTSGVTTTIDVAGITDPDTVSGMYIYRVHISDEALGIPEADEAAYYTNYLSDQDIVSGITATTAFEQDHRFINSLLTPETYVSGDITTGKKTMLLTTRTGTMNPHTGFIEPGVLVPLLPTTITNIGTAADPILRLFYDTLLDLPGTGDTKSYFLISKAQTRMQAYVTNSRTNRRLLSNIIQLEVRLPDSVNGTFFCNALNDIPAGLLTNPKNVNLISDGSIDATSGENDLYALYTDERNYVQVSGIYESYGEWFRRTRRGDTVLLDELATALADPTLSGLDIVTPIDCPAEIPMGFRLKSSTVTVASILDQVTFLDPNDVLPSGHFGV